MVIKIKKIFTKNKKNANDKKIMFCKYLNSFMVFILFSLSFFVNITKRDSIPNLIIKKKKKTVTK